MGEWRIRRAVDPVHPGSIPGAPILWPYSVARTSRRPSKPDDEGSNPSKAVDNLFSSVGVEET